MRNLIVILMGGLSGERKISFLTGKACSNALKKKGYKVKELDAKGYFVDKLRKLKPKLVFNALHGRYGEDGFVQSILEYLKIPYTHSGVLASSLAMDKELSRLIFKKNKSYAHFGGTIRTGTRWFNLSSSWLVLTDVVVSI